jgi:putative hydrolase of the HAD superfamily
MKTLLGASEEDFHRAYWAHREAYDRGALNGETYWAAVANDLGTTPDTAALNQSDVALWTQPNAPVIAWAASLQQRGIKTGILSNIGDSMELGIMQLGWMQAFAHHTFSHRLGIAKPDAAIYAYAAEGLATEPSAILFLDDRADNIAAARAAGMQAIQYQNHAAFLSEMEAHGFGWLLQS